MRSRVVTTTAAGTSIWLIHPSELNSQTAWMAETAEASVVRLSSARAQLAVAGSSTWPSSVIPRSSALISCSSGFQRRAAAVVGSARAASLSAGDSRTLPAVEHSTRPDSSEACRLASSWATMPPME